jgi:hypothetical protein
VVLEGCLDLTRDVPPEGDDAQPAAPAAGPAGGGGAPLLPGSRRSTFEQQRLQQHRAPAQAQLVGQALAGEAAGEGALVHAGSRRLVGAAAGPEGARVVVLYRSCFKALEARGARDVSAGA